MFDMVYFLRYLEARFGVVARTAASLVFSIQDWPSLFLKQWQRESRMDGRSEERGRL